MPFETWILPRSHEADFDALDDLACGYLAELLSDVMQGIDAAGGCPAYNYLIQTAPFDSDSAPYYHWRIVIIPRLTVMAGFEWGTAVTSIRLRLKTRPRNYKLIKTW